MSTEALTPQQAAVADYREFAKRLRREAFVQRAHRGDNHPEVMERVRGAATASRAAYCEADPEACKEREKP